LGDELLECKVKVSDFGGTRKIAKARVFNMSSTFHSVIGYQPFLLSQPASQRTYPILSHIIPTGVIAIRVPMEHAPPKGTPGVTFMRDIVQYIGKILDTL
jgi:hypothetical protein